MLQGTIFVQKIILCFWLCILAPYNFANSKICTEADSIEAYANEVTIKYFKDSEAIAVLVSLPEYIKGMKFKAIRLSKGRNGNIFVMPLYFEVERKKVKSYFFANESTLFESKITVEYQLNIYACPSVIEFSLEHKPKYSEN